ncbi:MAG: hypothetical protein L6437_04705 [Kiritimatiellae bacterium]|nr:hypothetical protein [Kiritimatiellia bacterium]
MAELTPRERVKNLLERKPVDRAAFSEGIWQETINRWAAETFLYFRDRGLELAVY